MPFQRAFVWLGAAAAAASLAATIRAQSAAQSPPQFKSGVSILRLDASVVDDSGRAIGDLKPEDFKVKK